MPAKPTFGFVLEYVDDIKAARDFYVDVLGLEVEREHPTFVQFESFAIASDESLSGTRDLELYWVVDNADAALADAVRDRAKIAEGMREMPFGKVFALKSPSGAPRFVLEWARNRPSRAVGKA
jgi:catechol 2,3-dioxygenase-like lactoylglutathione lyase family enzyme